ncbi:MAG: sigma-54-dependent transcriptional regulator [Myxococcales bacterium]
MAPSTPQLSAAGDSTLDVLVVDDEEAIRLDLSCALGDAGHRVTAAADGAEAGDLLQRRAFDLALIDIRLPKVDGLSLFRRVREQSPDTAVILLTAHATVPDAVSALKEGAFDYVTKPFDSEELTLRVIGRVAERCALRRALSRALPRPERELIGRAPALRRLLQQLEVVAQNVAPVLITGESGTGKELIARLLHDRSPRAQGPFVAVNCAALPETLLEAELFGHERGAYTGADRRRDGRFQAAEGGTLLLDEVSEIPLAAQTKLLRVLQEGTVEPLGSSTPVKIDARVLSATNRNLRELVAERRFREDLYYRLNVLDLNVPPLRERLEDLPLLIDHFLHRFAPPGAAPPTLSAEAQACLAGHPFPGNVRELEHAIERAVVLSNGGEIRLEHLPPDMARGTAEVPAAEPGLRPLAQAVQAFERDYLERALALGEGRRAEVARRLGISRKSLWQKLRKHGLDGG